MVSAQHVLAVVGMNWRLDIVRCARIQGGMNSSAWLVAGAGRRLVAKLVPARHRPAFEAGLLTAERLERCGIAAGAPMRTVDGALTAPLGDGVLALLGYVAGVPLDRGDPVQRHRWGQTLGRVHAALAGYRDPALPAFHWVRPTAAHLSIEPWIRPAVAAAVDAVGALCATQVLTRGVLHGDPAPDSFRLDPATGRIGLIDWGSSVTGPLVYDVASAVMYCGGPDLARGLLDGYLDTGPLPAEQVYCALPAMLRFRFAVQADYFAYRLSVDDRTGIAGAEENWAGLHDARSMMAGLADPTAGPADPSALASG